MNPRDHRPAHIDLNSRAFSPSRAGPLSPRDLPLPSPRTGEAPPALSPLDAFAQQSRLLAQKLEASNLNGQRLSRLPPLTIAHAVAQARHGYLNSAPPSATAEKDPSPSSIGAPGSSNIEVAQPQYRPVSHYPLISAFDDAESIISRDSTIPTIIPVQEEDEEHIDTTSQPSIHNDPFNSSNAIRSASPEPIAGGSVSPASSLHRSGAKRQATTDSQESKSSTFTGGLAPYQSPPRSRTPRGLKDRPSIRSVRQDTEDDSDSLSFQDGRYLIDRKSSYSSAHEAPKSPFSPIFAPHHSPSMSQENLHPRASVNFSRPISRNERPSFDIPNSYFDGTARSFRVESPPPRPSLDVLSLQDSIMDSPRQPSIPWIDAGTPLSLTDDESSTRPGTPSGASLSKNAVSLPRGRAFSKDLPSDSAPQDSHRWKPLHFDDRDRRRHENNQPRSTSGAGNRYRDDVPLESDIGPLMRTSSALDARSVDKALKGHRSNPSFPPATASTITEARSSRTLRPTQPAAGDLTKPRPRTSHNSPHERQHQPTRPTLSSMPDPQILADSLAQLTPEGHLAKGLACHEDGEVQKSTYHLRLAARGGEPTGMLMYALACRHGWGMRPNQAEGVAWLRKAVDSSGLVVAEDETAPDGTNERAMQRRGSAIVAAKRHRAQFALAIYELGQSYMNGWGIKQDKTQALRCYELAGSWDDGDAIVEAAFCYAKGVGCKKDLKKAAEYYRRADKMGMQMTGQSWIYKDKYMPPPIPTEDDRSGRSSDKDKEKKPRDKSRTRTIFGGRKKSMA